MSDAFVILGLAALAFCGYLVVRRVRRQQNPPQVNIEQSPAPKDLGRTPEAVTNALKRASNELGLGRPIEKRRPSARAVPLINDTPTPAAEFLDPNPLPLSSLLDDSSSHRHEPVHHTPVHHEPAPSHHHEPAPSYHHDPSPVHHDPSPSYHSPDTGGGGGGYDGGVSGGGDIN
jgi:hypothetical protein